MEATSSSSPGAPMIGFSEAARVLQDLGICKAFGPSGRINGPNCQRFGKQDQSTGRWSWDVAELVRLARQKKTASSEKIESVAKQYGLPASPLVGLDVSRKDVTTRKASRAQLEKDFRDQVRELESLLRTHLPWQRPGLDRRALGELLHDALHMQILNKAKLAEMSYVNAVRNTLNHPGLGSISDDDLTRAITSVGAALAILRGNRTLRSD